MPPLDEGQAGANVGLYLAVVELAVCYIDILEIVLQLDDVAACAPLVLSWWSLTTNARCSIARVEILRCDNSLRVCLQPI